MICTKCNLEAGNYVAYRNVINGQPADPICYACAGQEDREALLALPIGGKYMAYLIKLEGKWYVANWPSTMKYPCVVRKGKHNIAGTRYDVWFSVGGQNYWGVTYGEFTQICHIKRVK